MRSRRDALKIAKKLNADVEARRKHDVAIVRYKGKRTAQFGIRRGSGDLPHPHIHSQLSVTPAQCRDLANRPLSRDGYFEIVRSKGRLAE